MDHRAVSAQTGKLRQVTRPLSQKVPNGCGAASSRPFPKAYRVHRHLEVDHVDKLRRL